MYLLNDNCVTMQPEPRIHSQIFFYASSQLNPTQTNILFRSLSWLNGKYHMLPFVWQSSLN